jgi:Flp pilus assembly pilin Flp
MLDRFNVWVGSLIARTQDLKNESGQTFVEYALVLSVIVVGILLLVTATGLGGAIADAMKEVVTAIKNDPAPAG